MVFRAVKNHDAVREVEEVKLASLFQQHERFYFQPRKVSSLAHTHTADDGHGGWRCFCVILPTNELVVYIFETGRDRRWVSPLQKQLELFVCRWRRQAHIQRGLDKQCPLGLRLQRPFRDCGMQYLASVPAALSGCLFLDQTWTEKSLISVCKDE